MDQKIELVKFTKAKPVHDPMNDNEKQYEPDGVTWVNPKHVEQVQDHLIIFTRHYTLVMEDANQIRTKLRMGE